MTLPTSNRSSLATELVTTLRHVVEDDDIGDDDADGDDDDADSDNDVADGDDDADGEDGYDDGAYCIW